MAKSKGQTTQWPKEKKTEKIEQRDPTTTMWSNYAGQNGVVNDTFADQLMLYERTPLQQQVDNHIVCSSTICLINGSEQNNLCGIDYTNIYHLAKL